MIQLAKVSAAAHGFIARHTAADGFHVHRIEGTVAERAVELIPLFVRSAAARRAGMEVIGEHFVTDLTFEKGHGVRRTVLTSAPFSRGTAGLSDDCFDGEIDLLYKAQQLRFLSFRYVGHYGERRATFVATKSREALEEFWNLLRRFQRSYEIRTVRVWGEGRLPRDVRKTWDELIMPANKKADLKSTVESFMTARSSYRELGLPWRRGLLFGGAPGCGKSTAIKVIAAQVKASFWVLPINAKTTDGDLTYFFKCAAESAPAVCVIEDLDRVTETAKEMSMSHMLNQLDGIGTGRDQGILLISTANHVDRLDPALSPKRPGRYDRYFLFDLPTAEERAAILRLRGKSRFGEKAMDQAVALTKGYTHAMVQELVVNALLKGINEGRAPTDQELLDGLSAMRSEHKASEKKSGDLLKEAGIGFGSECATSA